jgi:hypothetical protein
MLTPKDLSIIIIKVTCIVSFKCKIIFTITSTYITSVICGNVGFLTGTIALEVAYSMSTKTVLLLHEVLVVSSLKHEVLVVVLSM